MDEVALNNVMSKINIFVIVFFNINTSLKIHVNNIGNHVFAIIINFELFLRFYPYPNIGY